MFLGKEKGKTREIKRSCDKLDVFFSHSSTQISPPVRFLAPVKDGPVMLRGDPRRLHPRAAVPLRDQPHFPLLLQVPGLLWHRDDERCAPHASHLAAAWQR